MCRDSEFLINVRMTVIVYLIVARRKSVWSDFYCKQRPENRDIEPETKD